MSVLNYLFSENESEIENIRKSNDLKNLLLDKGFKTSLIRCNMLDYTDIDYMSSNLITDKKDFYLFTSMVTLINRRDSLNIHLKMLIEKIIKLNRNIIFIGYVPEEYKKYVTNKVNMLNVIRTINESNLKFITNVSNDIINNVSKINGNIHIIDLSEYNASTIFDLIDSYEIDETKINNIDSVIIDSRNTGSTITSSIFKILINFFLEKGKNVVVVGENLPESILKMSNEKEIDINKDALNMIKKIHKNKYIKTFESFQLEQPKNMSELLEKLSVVEKNILDSIKAEEINIEAFFNKNLKELSLENISEHPDFNSVLKIKGLKKANVEYTDDYETFLLNPFKYLLIKDKLKNNLQDPDYILIQTFNSTEQDWNKIRMYKINGKFKNFYDKLSNKTIELEDQGTKYIYQTSTKNEWELTNHEGSEKFPRFVRKEELLKIIKSL
jgi:hypothetical protein